MKQYVTVYDQFVIKRVISRLATEVADVIEKRGAENCVLMTVLEGGAYLSNKIINQLPQGMLAELTTASIKVSSYHGFNREGLMYDYLPNTDCEGKTVILIDDFCDSGSTLSELSKLYYGRFEAEEVVAVTLLARKHRKLIEGTKLIYGIEDDTNNFYYGCGLDDNGKGRFVNDIYTIIETKDVPSETVDLSAATNAS